MLKVDVEKFLADHNMLQEKKTGKIAELETQVRVFAESLGYDEEKTLGLIDYVQKQNGSGLSTEEDAKLQILDSYLYEIEEEEVFTVKQSNYIDNL